MGKRLDAVAKGSLGAVGVLNAIAAIYLAGWASVEIVAALDYADPWEFPVLPVPLLWPGLPIFGVALLAGCSRGARSRRRGGAS